MVPLNLFLFFFLLIFYLKKIRDLFVQFYNRIRYIIFFLCFCPLLHFAGSFWRKEGLTAMGNHAFAILVQGMAEEKSKTSWLTWLRSDDEENQEIKVLVEVKFLLGFGPYGLDLDWVQACVLGRQFRIQVKGKQA